MLSCCVGNWDEVQCKEWSEHRVLIAWRADRQAAAGFDAGSGIRLWLVMQCRSGTKNSDCRMLQTIELGRQVSGGVRGRTHWIVGVQPPLMKRLMCYGELKVVHLPVALLEQHWLRAVAVQSADLKIQIVLSMNGTQSCRTTLCELPGNRC